MSWEKSAITYAKCECSCEPAHPRSLTRTYAFTHVSGKRTGNFSLRTRHLALLRGCARAMKDWSDGKVEEPFSPDEAQTATSGLHTDLVTYSYILSRWKKKTNKKRRCMGKNRHLQILFWCAYLCPLNALSRKFTSRKHTSIILPPPPPPRPLKPHFCIVKLGFTGVYISFLISVKKHRLWVLVRTASARRF